MKRIKLFFMGAFQAIFHVRVKDGHANTIAGAKFPMMIV